MKFRVTLKDPDGPADCLMESAAEEAAKIPGLDDEERQAVADSRLEKMKAFAGKWLEYGEYITVEFDTDAGTATVIPGG